MRPLIGQQSALKAHAQLIGKRNELVCKPRDTETNKQARMYDSKHSVRKARITWQNNRDISSAMMCPVAVRDKQESYLAESPRWRETKKN